MRKLIYSLSFFLLLLACGGEEEVDPCGELQDAGGFFTDLAFPPEDDVQLGMRVRDQIYADTSEFHEFILSRDSFPEAYAYLNDMRDRILDYSNLNFPNEFAWEITIIDQDVLNAFATPGGYIFIYTGLIKYLDNVDDLAGVVGHEIAHADQRHSVNQLVKQYGISVLAGIVLGDDPGQLAAIAAQIAGTAAGLKFSREDEADADAASVNYLSEAIYACNGAARFFQKLEADNQSAGVPEFLSTHPSPANRVEDINQRADCLGCETENTTQDTNSMTYQEFINSLPGN